jgi:hypothetical protein
MFLVLAMLSGCASDTQRRAAKNTVIEKQTALEIDRICSLPQPEREAELVRIQAESGIVVQCGKD